MAEFPSIQHVAVTVSDLDRSVPWYGRLIGADPVLDEDTGPFRHVVWLIGWTLLGLHQFAGSDAGTDFDEHRLGLDHVAFGCANRAELEAWRTASTTSGSPTEASSTPGTVRGCRSGTRTTCRTSFLRHPVEVVDAARRLPSGDPLVWIAGVGASQIDRPASFQYSSFNRCLACRVICWSHIRREGIARFSRPLPARVDGQSRIH